MFSFLHPSVAPEVRKSIREAYKSVVSADQKYIDIMKNGGSLWSASDKIHQVYSDFGKEIASLQGLPATKSIATSLGMANPIQWLDAMNRWSHHAIGMVQDTLTVSQVLQRMKAGMPMRQAIKETNEMMPTYWMDTEIPHPEMGGMIGKAITRMSQLPTEAAETRGARAFTNFSRFYYSTAKAAFGPPVRAVREAARGVKFQRAGEGAKAKEAYGKAVENVARTAALMTAFAYGMPYVDQAIKSMTGDQRARAMRWGSFAVTQALQDTLQGKETSYEALRLMLVNLSPVTAIGMAGYEHLQGVKKYHPGIGMMPQTKNELLEKQAENIPGLNILHKPFKNAPTDIDALKRLLIDQTIGYGHKSLPPRSPIR